MIGASELAVICLGAAVLIGLPIGVVLVLLLNRRKKPDDHQPSL